MDELAVSQALASGYVFNINLPDWKSKGEDSKRQVAERVAEKQKRQNLVAFGILITLVIVIIYLKRK